MWRVTAPGQLWRRGGRNCWCGGVKGSGSGCGRYLEGIATEYTANSEVEHIVARSQIRNGYVERESAIGVRDGLGGGRDSDVPHCHRLYRRARLVVLSSNGYNRAGVAAVCTEPIPVKLRNVSDRRTRRGGRCRRGDEGCEGVGLGKGVDVGLTITVKLEEKVRLPTTTSTV